MRILIVTTLSLTINSFLIPQILMLMEQGNQVDVACKLDQPIKKEIESCGVKIFDIPFSRSPISKDNAKAIIRLKKLIEIGNYDLVHCHTPNASVITRLVCRSKRRKGLKIIYTAHGFHFYKGAPLINWTLYYPIEYLCAFWTDVLITINKEDYELAQKHMHSKRIEYVPGVGIDLEKFSGHAVDKLAIRNELGIPANAQILLSVGELNKNKNHEIVIKAIAGMDVYYIIAGTGNEKEALEHLARDVGMESRVKLIGYRSDIADLYRIVDAFVFPSFREGLSVSLMEAMASGLAVACSRIRGNVDLIDENGGVTFDPHDFMSCKNRILDLLDGKTENQGLYNIQKVKQFGLKAIIDKMKWIYGF